MIRGCGCVVAALMLLLGAGAGGVVAAGGAGGGSSTAAETAVAPGSATAMVAPVRGAAVTQWFGCTAFLAEPVDLACAGGHFHSGIDLAAPLGTPVMAALGGTAQVLRDATGYGLHVVVTADAGVTTLYGHLSQTVVADGDILGTGELLGAVGSTGNSTGPHLHFEVRRSGLAENPLLDVTLP